MDKLLTISTAAYNAEKTIRRTLDSMLKDADILQQLEIIVVNDGSRDSTEDIIHEYARQYPDTVKVISKENGGYGSTLTAATAAAEGRYFKIVDGDDMVDSMALSELMKYLESAQSDMIISPFSIFTEGSSEIRIIDTHPGLAQDIHSIESAEFSDGLAVFEICVKTELLRSCHPEYLEHCFYTDNEFVMACLLAADSVCAYKRAVSCYRIGSSEQSMSLEGKKRHFRDCFEVSDRIFRMYAEKEDSLKGSRKLLADRLVSSMQRLTYMSVLLQDRPSDHIDKLRAYDRDTRAVSENVYMLGAESVIVRVGRSGGVKVLNVFGRIVRYRERRNIPWLKKSQNS